MLWTTYVTLDKTLVIIAPGPMIIKLFPYSAEPSMKFYLLLNSKLLICTVVFMLSLAECELFYAYEFENANISWHFYIYQQRKFQLRWFEHEIFYLLINSKVLISAIVFMLSLAECELFYACEYENANISWHFHIYQQRKFYAQLSWARKNISSGPGHS